ncbi:MAG: hypothetical protein ABJH98_03420 [Reichenbachiella sp.]|uniref:hypothetical protein n=1 Tax=Reichenbachiella sp. TaxID=2184521 RepID=UPI003298EE84
MKYILPSLVIAFFSYSAFAQQGIGIGTDNVDESAVLQIDSPTGKQGILIPRVDIDLVATPANGLIIYNTDDAGSYDNGLYIYDKNVTPNQWRRLVMSPAVEKIDMNSNQIINLSDGTNAKDAVNKDQLDAVDLSNINRDGSDVMTGDLNMGNHKILNLSDGTGNNDAVNLNQLNVVKADLNGGINDLADQLGSAAAISIVADSYCGTGFTVSSSIVEKVEVGSLVKISGYIIFNVTAERDCISVRVTSTIPEFNDIYTPDFSYAELAIYQSSAYNRVPGSVQAVRSGGNNYLVFRRSDYRDVIHDGYNWRARFQISYNK